MPPRSLAILLVLLLLAAGSALLSQRSASKADPAIDTVEAQFLQILNEYRAANGKAPLVLHPNLNAAADWMSTDMATDNYWPQNHYDNEDPPRSPAERAAAFGYYGGVGENLAAGFASAQSVFDAWRNSPGHNANMLGGYTVIGIGRAYSASSSYRYYWTTDFGFGAPPTDGPTNPPTAPPTPTPTPTSVPTAPPTALPTATAAPTPSPTQTPGPPEIVWNDIDCDRDVTTRDAMLILANVGGINQQSAAAGACRAVGSGVYIDGIFRMWGDVDCNLTINTADAMKLLRYLTGLWFQPEDVYCPQPGIGI